MNLKALTVALVLGSSSVAMASPSVGFEVNAELRADAYGRWSSRPTVRDHRTLPPRTRVVAKLNRYQHLLDRNWVSDDGYWQPRTVMLDSNVEFSGATTQTIHVGGRAGKFTTLELEAVAGSPEIQQITIQYEGGTGQAFHNLNATLHRGRPLVLTLNTVPRAIEKIIVYAPGYGTAKRTWSDMRDAAGVFSISAR